MEYRPLDISWEEYLTLDAGRVKEVQLAHLRNNDKWSQRKLRELNDDWIIVLAKSGTIYLGDNNPETYPSPEYLREIAEKTKEIPYVFSKHPLIEEKQGALETRV